jgi:hypothetical protein
LKDGWYVQPSRGGVVTNEMIAKIEEELDAEDASPSRRELPAEPDG